MRWPWEGASLILRSYRLQLYTWVLGVPVHMPTETILQSFARHAMQHAVFRQLSLDLWSGRVPECKGAVAYGPTRNECGNQLYTVLEDWALIAVQQGLNVPVIDGLDLNTEENRKLVLEYS